MDVMAMNLKTWLPLGCAVLLGTLAAKIGHDMLSRKPAEKTVEVHVAKVVVAKENVAGGSPLKASDLAVTKVDEKLAPAGTISSPEELVGRVVTGQVMKGQPILQGMLAPKGSAVGLTAIVPEGKRAVTLEINEVSGVAGLLSVGCRVDVISTFPGEDGQMLSKTIVNNLQVIAVGRKFATSGTAAAQQAAKEGKDASEVNDGPVARNVTLLVTPKEAEMLALASQTGNPRLVLRGSRDESAAATNDAGITLARLRGDRPKDNEPGTWSKLVTAVGTLSQQVQVQTPPQNSLFANSSPAPSTQPAKPVRQVTVIRNTKEENVQLDAPRPIQGGPVMADTKDKTDE
jgi:pilus assembly protein CpaB